MVCLLMSFLPFLAIYILNLISLVLQLQGISDRDPGSLETGKTVHHWMNVAHVILCFVNPFYCFPGTLLAIGFTMTETMVQMPGLEMSSPKIFGSVVAVPLVGAVFVSLLLAATIGVDLRRCRLASSL